MALVRERTIPTERPPPVGEVSANFCKNYKNCMQILYDSDKAVSPVLLQGREVYSNYTAVRCDKEL
jgi:hypothetical protein